jgi:hypothetical protein
MNLGNLQSVNSNGQPARTVKDRRSQHLGTVLKFAIP